MAADGERAMGPPMGGSLSNTNSQDQPTTTNYTIPGILHFIKHEWSRFEKERANWEVERAELQAKIAFLQGERKGHENLMHDLVRRIKMLEYALKQERAKLYKLQHGKDMGFDLKPPNLEPEPAPNVREMSAFTAQREESRKILRDYLREVGFPDNVLEARVSRIAAYKSLYGQNQPLDQVTSSSVRSDSPKPSLPSLTSSTPPHLPSLTNGPIVNGSDMTAQSSSGSPTFPRQSLDDEAQPEEETNEGEDSEEVVSALSQYGFLDDQDEDGSDDSDSDDESGGWGFVDPTRDSDDTSSGIGVENASDDFEAGDISVGGSGSEDTPPQEPWASDFSEQVTKYRENKPRKTKDVTSRPSRSELQRMEQFMNQSESAPAQSSQNTEPSPFGVMRLPGRRKRGPDPDALGLSPGGVTGETIKASMLGDLAVIDIANQPMETLGNTSAEVVKKWDDKFTMRSHFDAITSLVFHPTEQMLITASEDSTLKIWSLQKATQSMRNNRIVDLEPTHTFRGHTGAVMCVGVSEDGSCVYSGGVDTSIRSWKLPSDEVDPFDPYEPLLHAGLLHGHTDTVWDVRVQPTTGLLLSCSADGRCILWNSHNTNPLLKLFQVEDRCGLPTSVDFISTDSYQMVASYSAAKAIIFDLETGQSVLNLDSSSTYDGTPGTQINRVVCHPTLPVLATAHEDKYIRFYDKNTGKVTHSMTAHPDAVAALTFDPHGLYLLSGGHDGSLRFWSVDSKTCVQVVPAHRKHYDESVNSVACHPTLPYFASAGADGVAKVFE